jgi:hypothetical protein
MSDLHKNAMKSKAQRGRPRTPTPAVAYTIAEFCEAHRISQAQYFNIRKKGIGPREMRVGGRILISHEAALAWRRAREES